MIVVVHICATNGNQGLNVRPCRNEKRDKYQEQMSPRSSLLQNGNIQALILHSSAPPSRRRPRGFKFSSLENGEFAPSAVSFRSDLERDKDTHQGFNGFHVVDFTTGVHDA